MSLHEIIFQNCQERAQKILPISDGAFAKVFLITLKNERKIIAKTSAPNHSLLIECEMLSYLKEKTKLPVPTILHSHRNVILMEYLGENKALSKSSQLIAADYISQLHRITHYKFGFNRETAIGGLPQKNQFNKSWVDFFRNVRLLHMADEAYNYGSISTQVRHKIDTFCQKLESRIGEPTQPSLIHGDLWSGNILSLQNKINGFIDPAIYFADHEIELAFITLFSTFDQIFFSRYQEQLNIKPGFFKERRHIYNLYPLLVHARLFGNAYQPEIETILDKFS